MIYTGERAIPWNPATGTHIMHAHVMRYAWALQFAAGKVVCDLGCGCGYGSFMLSWVAREVIGVDCHTETMDYAREHFKASNLSFWQRNITQESPPADLYVAFEVLEHLNDPRTVTRQCLPLVWSMPISDGSRYHVRPYSLPEIARLTGGVGYYQDVGGQIAPIGPGEFVIASGYALGVAGV